MWRHNAGHCAASLPVSLPARSDPPHGSSLSVSSLRCANGTFVVMFLLSCLLCTSERPSQTLFEAFSEFLSVLKPIFVLLNPLICYSRTLGVLCQHKAPANKHYCPCCIYSGTQESVTLWRLLLLWGTMCVCCLFYFLLFSKMKKNGGDVFVLKSTNKEL